jgi:hypothetical protein
MASSSHGGMTSASAEGRLVAYAQRRVTARSCPALVDRVLSACWT